MNLDEAARKTAVKAEPVELVSEENDVKKCTFWDNWLPDAIKKKTDESSSKQTQENDLNMERNLQISEIKHSSQLVMKETFNKRGKMSRIRKRKGR